uniref:Uncharacterized protein n=1 Tax=Onchocerca volvulus TaxID=6282 RepID=A0A8R1XZ61_ONCVO
MRCEVCLRCWKIFSMESILLRINSAIYILDDIHEQFTIVHCNFDFKIYSTIPGKEELNSELIPTCPIFFESNNFNIIKTPLKSANYEFITLTDITNIGSINDFISADPGNFPGKYIPKLVRYLKVYAFLLELF